ncbi:MAG: hypothetical protein LUQ59_10270 [Methanothrix sp.]|nr:hypothetical protein [Methanothrix sp.]
MTVILMVTAAVLLPQAVASDQLDSAGFSGSGGNIFPQGSDAKKIENKIAEALASLKPAINPALADLNSSNGPINNSSLQNTSQNSSLVNSTVNSEEHAQSNPFEIAEGNSPAGQNAGASSKGSFNGFYGMTASRHEIGKSGIDSSMFLSGNFEMEKSVKFQDQGI